MNKTAKLIIVIVLTASIVVVAVVKKTQKSTIAPVADVNRPAATIQGNLPRLVDLGADKCIPCKMMAPILEELKTTYAGKLQVDFIDVWKNPDEAKKSGIRVIPTQIFYDASGKELFRHEGFFSKEDILGKWKEFGINLEK
jgi:thioredoxin 1